MFEILIVIIFIRTITDVSFKKAVHCLHFDSVGSLFSNFGKLATNPFLWVGVTGGVLNVVLWLVALRQFDLSYAYPFLSLSYITIILAGKFLFKEHLGIHIFRILWR